MTGLLRPSSLSTYWLHRGLLACGRGAGNTTLTGPVKMAASASLTPCVPNFTHHTYTINLYYYLKATMDITKQCQELCKAVCEDVSQVLASLEEVLPENHDIDLGDGYKHTGFPRAQPVSIEDLQVNIDYSKRKLKALDDTMFWPDPLLGRCSVRVSCCHLVRY